MSDEGKIIGVMQLAELVNQSRQGIGWKARRYQIPGMLNCSSAQKHRSHGYRFDLADTRLRQWIEKNRVDECEPASKPGRKPKSKIQSLTEIAEQLPSSLRGAGWGEFIYTLKNNSRALARKLKAQQEKLKPTQRAEIGKALRPLMPFIQLKPRSDIFTSE